MTLGSITLATRSEQICSIRSLCLRTIARSRSCLVPKWSLTAALLPCPAASLTWRLETAKMLCSAVEKMTSLVVLARFPFAIFSAIVTTAPGLRSDRRRPGPPPDAGRRPGRRAGG